MNVLDSTYAKVEDIIWEALTEAVDSGRLKGWKMGYDDISIINEHENCAIYVDATIYDYNEEV